METSPGNVALCSTCGRTLTAEGECLPCLVRVGFDQPVAELASPVFGDFEIVRREDGSFWELGRGAMGVTYRADDKVLNRSVALKVIDAPAAEGGGQAVRDRFLREARAAAALRHPNVAGVFQFGASAAGDGCYYAMELVEGETLEAIVRRDGPLKVEAALEIAVQVTRALIAAAAHGLIHRDLKPGNIMLTRSDAAAVELEVKVIDFGLAKAITDGGKEMDLTKGGFIGTPAFASPEQFSGAPADARSDIYSLGVTLWYALTGEVPYEGKTIEEIRHCQSDLPLPVEKLVARKMPTAVIQLLRRILAVDPVKRPASARELMEALESCRVRLGIIPPPRSKAWQTGLKLAALVVVVAIAAAFVAFRVQGRKAADSTPGPAKSIAVLPFTNMSEDKANAYFADGIQEEILTRLAKIADLRVISRTSTQNYKSRPGNLSEIAQQLSVANILEGSVQKVGDQVRVNVQLINAKTDSHIWAEIYDRKLQDILAVESEIAKAIAESLQARLSGSEQQALAVKPTNNSEAYDAYLRGLAAEDREYIGGATPFYERSVQLDPGFAVAWSRLSRAHALEYFNRGTATERDAAERALGTAQKLQPNAPETLLAQAFFQYWVLRDYEAAKTTFGLARKVLPGSGEVPAALAKITRRQGHWDESITYWEQSLALDPLNYDSLTECGLTYRMLRQFPAALSIFDRGLTVRPNDLDLVALKAEIYQAQGDLKQAGKLLTGLVAQSLWGPATYCRWRSNQWVLERRYDEAIRVLEAELTDVRNLGGSFMEQNACHLQVSLATVQRLAHDSAGARVTAQAVQPTLETFRKAEPDNQFWAVELSQLYAVLDEKDAALREAERAVTLLPSAQDAVEGPMLEENLANVQTRCGEKDRPISALQHLLSVPYGFQPITKALLRIDPAWDDLRSDPRFQKLVEERSR